MSLSTPPAFESATAVRVHRMRLARGACWVVAISLVAGLALTVLDAATPLPDWLRGVTLAMWLTGFGVLAWYLVFRQWRSQRTINPSRVARQELSGNLLAAATVSALLAGCLLAAMKVPGAAEHVRRVALPWYRPATAQYRVVVMSKEPTVRSGDSVTLSAYVENVDKAESAVELPAQAMAIFRDLHGKETQQRMNEDGNGAYLVTLPAVSEDFHYRIAVGSATSEWLAVTVIQPAEPTRQTVLKVIPPAYAVDRVPTQILSGFVPFSGTQYGRVEVALRFSVPVENALFEWLPASGGTGQAIPISLSSDKESGTASLALKATGTLNLITYTRRSDKELKSTQSVPVRVTSDQPPILDWVAGVCNEPLSIRPGASVRIGIGAHDDLAIASAVIEYATDATDQNLATIAIPLNRPSPDSAEGRLEFNLPGKLREGESIRYRIRVSDIRQAADLGLTPQSIVYPQTGWARLTVNTAARPIEEQEILFQHRAISEGFKHMVSELTALIEEMNSIEMDSKQRLEFHHEVRLKKAREVVDSAIVGELDRYARAASLTTELQPFVRAMRVCSDPLREASGFLEKAVTDNSARRLQLLDSARKKCLSAKLLLERLRQRNEQLTQARLDGFRLEDLQAAQLALLERVKKDAGNGAAELARLQQELETRLTQVIAESEPLRLAMIEAKQRWIDKLVVQSSSLAERINELNADIGKLQDDVRASMLKDIAAGSKASCEEAIALLARIEQAARLTAVNPPRAEEFRRVEGLIAEGKTIDALAELQRLAEAANGVAATFENWTAERTNPRLACHQFVLWQKDLVARYRSATRGSGRKFKSLPEAMQTEFRREQTAIRAAVSALAMPPGYNLAGTHAAAVKPLAVVSEQLDESGEVSDTSLDAAVKGLIQLQEQIPSIADRLTRTRNDLLRLFKEQEAITSQAEQIVSKPDLTQSTTISSLGKKLRDLAGRQRQQLALFSQLDLPGEETRRADTLAAMTAAAMDLEAGLPFDVYASQQWLKREFERLKRVFDRSPQLDEIAEGLAVRLEKVLAAMQSAGPNKAPDPFAPPAEIVQEVHNKLLQFTSTLVPQSPTLRNDAQTAVKEVQDVGFFETSKFSERCEKLKLAIEAIQALANRLRGEESDLARVQRFAFNRAIAAEKAKSLLGKEVRAQTRKDSIEAQKQLGLEMDELMHTRVGSSGQLLKQRVLARYLQLKSVSEPDHDPKSQHELAELLDELAAIMADTGELATTPLHPLPHSIGTETAHYLPSTELVEGLRKVARRHLDLRERLNHLNEAVIKGIGSNPLSTRLDVRTQELSRSAEQLAVSFRQAWQDRDVHEEEKTLLEQSEKSGAQAAKLLLESTNLSSSGQRAVAAKVRQEAVEILGKTKAKLAALTTSKNSTSDSAVIDSTVLLREAFAHSRDARDGLEKNMLKDAEKAMRATADAMGKARERRLGDQ